MEKPETNQSQPIIPPPELVHQWWKTTPVQIQEDDPNPIELIVARAAQWGWDQREPELQERADQELEACCEWLSGCGCESYGRELRAARRPKPPSLAEQGLKLLEPPSGPVMLGTPEYRLTEFQAQILRAALDRLAKLEAQQ